jgi:hypothetical protein
MFILELIIELFDSFNFLNLNSIEFVTSDITELLKDLKLSTVSDFKDCAKAHSKIEKREGQNIIPFVGHAKKVNKTNRRKTTVECKFQ